MLQTPLTKELSSTIPLSAGVYQFYGDSGALLYIGKSVCLRKRILSHFRANSSTKKRLITQTKTIQWLETAGELSALIKEACLIKKNSPIFNRLLRRRKTLFAISTLEDVTGYLRLHVHPYQPLRPNIMQISCMFRHKQSAQEMLRTIVKQNGLCLKLAGLDNSKGPCFFYQIHKCQGACIGQENIADYNARAQQALQSHAYKSWPFEGRVALKEINLATQLVEYHIVDHWCYLATVANKAELMKLSEAKLTAHFDLDIYNILVYYLTNKREALEIIILPNAFLTAVAVP